MKIILPYILINVFEACLWRMPWGSRMMLVGGFGVGAILASTWAMTH